MNIEIRQKKHIAMSSNDLKIPKMIDLNKDTFPDVIDTTPTKLKNYVRWEYLKYLENILRLNYNTWCTIKSPNYDIDINEMDVRRCAEYLEENAVRSAIVVEVYRKYILRQISEIRNQTAQFTLNSIFQDWKTKICKRDVSCQTDEMKQEIKIEKVEKSISMEISETSCNKSLDEKISKFESMLKEREINETEVRKQEINKVSIKTKYIVSKDQTSLLTPDIPDSSAYPYFMNSSFIEDNKNIENNTNTSNDNIECELEKLFGAEEDEDDFAKIFGIKVDKKMEKNDIKDIPEPKTENVIDIPTDVEQNEIELKEAQKKKLKESIWPCELHMQRLRYRNVMLEIADKGMRHHDKVRRRILELFGEDSDDEELCCYSPSIELDEILLASCKIRIAPMIVGALMSPLREGRIASKQLFKKLAKRLAESILKENQYPTANHVKLYVDNYFIEKEMIHCLSDIT